MRIRPRWRRWFLQQCGVGLGSPGTRPTPEPRRVRRAGLSRRVERRSPRPRGPAPCAARPSGSSSCSWRARSSHLELFDNKPQLAKFDGTLPPPNCSKAIARRSSIRTRSCSGRSSSSPGTRSRAAPSFRSCCPSWRRWSTTSRSCGSMKTDAFNHAPGQILMSTGSQIFGRPSVGAWATYGLGCEIPATCPASSSSARARKAPAAATRTGECGSSRPSIKGVQFRTSGDPVLYLSNPNGVDPQPPARDLDAREPAEPDAARRGRRP